MLSLTHRLNTFTIPSQSNLAKLGEHLTERLKALDEILSSMDTKGAFIEVRNCKGYGYADNTIRFDTGRDDQTIALLLDVLTSERKLVKEQLEAVQTQLNLIDQIVTGAFATLGRTPSGAK